MTSDGQSTSQQSPLGILCGSGALPYTVADAVRRQGRPVVLFPFRHVADEFSVARYTHAWISLGQFGRFISLARAHNCTDLVWIGGLVRPSLWHIRFDLKTILLLPKIAVAFRGGDNHLLTGIGRLFEQQGFRLHGAHEVAPEILVPAGALAGRPPNESERADILLGWRLLSSIGSYDVGQSAVIANGHVLAVEGVEGTDGMLDRIAAMRLAGRDTSRRGTGVLVKASKAGQDQRFDLPTIGPKTIDGVARAGLAGVAVVAGLTIIAEADRLKADAERAGIFVYGLEASTI